MSLNQELTDLLTAEGCTILGFADLRILQEEPRKKLDTGIIVGFPYTAEGMKENLAGNPDKFWRDAGATFEPLERFTEKVVQFLKERKYKANTKTYKQTVVTAKTVGTLSGIGWIGRCAMLTTKETGPALRLSVILTNAPFECGTPITKSLCPEDCTACADICPAGAVKGGLWERGVHRDEFFDVTACGKGRGNKKNPCNNLCIAVCPYAKTGLGYE